MSRSASVKLPENYFGSKVVPVESVRPRGVLPKAISQPLVGIKQQVSAALNKAGIGLYPPEYNVKVHGPYYSWKYYGKQDALGQTKIGEVGDWLRRRNYHPTAMWRECSRLTALWKHKWFYPRRAGGPALVQGLMVTSLFFYVMTYRTQRAEKTHKYH